MSTRLALLILGISVSTALGADLASHYGQLYTDGPKSRRAVALTFDDGPSETTPKVLDLLKREKIKATFFEEGSQVVKYPQYSKRVVAEGHLLGNHSWDHPNFWSYYKPDAKEKLSEQIRSTQKAIKEAVGVDAAFMRMPHGFIGHWVDAKGHKAKAHAPGAHYDAWTKEVAKDEKIILVNWTYGSDWTNITKEKMLAGYLSSLRPGAILLMHDGEGDRSKMLWVLPRVIAELRKKGIEPVRIDDLLESELK